MWSSRARAFGNAIPRRHVLAGLASALVTPGLLAGCFRPMLAEDSPSAGLIGRIELPRVDDRFGYYLNASLVDRLGRTEAAQYRLAVKTRIDREGLAITQDNAVTRISLTAVADWALYPVGGEEPLVAERTVSQSGYNSTASLFATRSAKLDSEQRLARDLGERIARSILARAATIKAAEQS
jgi:LPS-assembly lipoprotein